MADQRLPDLNPVITPAGTDIVGARQSGDTRDKRLTVNQILSLEANDLTAAVVWANIPQANIPDPLLMGDGSAAAPSYSFSATGQQDVGFYRSETDGVSLALGGVAQATWAFTLAGIAGVGSDRPAMRNVSASATVPSLTPRNDDSNTGIGRNNPDELSLIAGGAEIARATEAAALLQFAIAPSGSSVVPELTGIGDEDTGLRWAGSNQLDVITAGSQSWHFSSAQFFSSPSDGPAMANDFGDITKAGFLPQQGDTDTGLGGDGNDSVSLVAGGIAGLRLKELNSGVIQAPVADVAITAFATGGQGSAVALKQSYNVISVCATAGDSVKLPPVFLVNSIVTIKNDGAESCDVFPASGDDLGQGADTAEALASGVSASYIATAANATWTLLLASADAALSFPILADDGTAGAPSYSFTGAPTSGLFRPSANAIEMSIAGTSRFRWDANFFMGKAANGPLIINQSSSATVPNLNPSSSDLNTGLGRAAADQLSLIAGGREIARCQGIAAAEQFIVSPGFIENNAALPALAFGDGDTGFLESAADVLVASIAGVARFEFNGDVFQSQVSTGPAIRNIAINAILPQFCPNQVDLNTGLGSPGQDEISMIAGGVEGVRYVEGSGVRILASYQLDDTLTAFAGGGQGSATLLGSSYNEFTVVATAGDSAKLMVGHPKGTKVFVKNNGANSMNIFPAVGDQIDTLGLNNAVSLPAGKSILFMTTTGNNTWTVMDFAFGGVPDPLLLGDGSAGAPTYSFASDPDTGFLLTNPAVLEIATAGTSHFEFNNTAFGGIVANSPRMLDELATATNPTFVPAKSDTDTGLGWAGANELTLIAGALDCIRIKNISAARALAFYVTAPIVLQTGVAVTSAGIHAALVNLGLFTA